VLGQNPLDLGMRAQRIADFHLRGKFRHESILSHSGLAFQTGPDERSR
jgi:hypothetical protein